MRWSIIFFPDNELIIPSICSIPFGCDSFIAVTPGTRSLHMNSKTLSLFILMACTAFSAFSDTSDPLLRLNTEMHTAPIRAIDTDAEYRFVLTAGDDRVARLWDAASGRLLKILRPFIGEGNDGRLYSCALSPDGTEAVVGGWTGPSGDKSLYFFNTASGSLTHRIDGFKDVINCLKYSDNGRYLAAGLGGSNGVSVISLRNHSVYKQLDGYSAQVKGLSFFSDGRLAVVSYDGGVRLYDRQFGLVKKVQLDKESSPRGVAVSPDDSRIAIAYYNSSKVEVYDGMSLRLLYTADSDGIDENDGMVNVAWSSDGRYLYAGGRYSKSFDGKWWRVVRRWDNQGRGIYEDFPGSGNTIWGLVSLNNGNLLVAGHRPDWARINNAGEQSLYREGMILSFRPKSFDKDMLLNPDASKVTFKPMSVDPMTFSISELSLTEGSFEGNAFRSQVGGITVTDWDNGENPRINGTLVEGFSKSELCRSVSVSPDGDTVILGTGWYLRAYNAEAELLWKIPSPGENWAVNCSADGKTVVVGLGDGTLRWYRLSDGKELLNLFVHSDCKRWVLWTPSGYYACSPSGEDLIGWHINHGRDRSADFFSASRFSERFYRPDVVALMLETLDEDQAITRANRQRNIRTTNASIASILPPVLAILSPSEGATHSSSTIQLRYSVRTPNNDPVQEVRAMVNGRPVETSRGLKLVASGSSGTEQSINISLMPGENYISLMAKNSTSWSDPATVMVKYQERQQSFVAKPKLYILAVGVSDYANPDYRLNYAAKDARDFAATMKAQEGGIYEDVEIRLLTDKDATQDNVFDGLDWIRGQATARDVAMIFVAGHGINDNSGRLYYLTHEADVDRLRRTSVAADEFTQTIQSIPGKVLYFMDTCHSGGVNIASRRGINSVDMTGIINELSSAESGAVVFASSSGKQYSLEDASWGNGAFTKALIEGLKGGADYTGSGKITINMLDLYISERVKELTRGQQTPTTAKPDTVPDYPVAVNE